MVVFSEFVEGPSSSSSIDRHRYDVFLSFRGADTRYSFTNHLYKALQYANITTFLDDTEIETGEDLKVDLESVIQASRASIIVLSRNYASSAWCLDELVLILDQHMTSNQIVIPVFYHVEPTHVRNQEKESTFGVAMAEHKRKMEAETDANKRNEIAQKIGRWEKALTEVADLERKDVNGRLETVLIEEIVKDIYSRLRISSRSHLPQLFGMYSSIKFITSWLKDASSRTRDILTILGMGGIGKTSLAKYVHGLHSHEFDTSCFIEDISRRCDEKLNRSRGFNRLLYLQKQLYDDISEPSSVQVHDVSIYTSKIEDAVACKKVFVVLDDIDSVDQIDALLGSKGFYPGSKIIITTSNECLSESCALFKMNVKRRLVKHFLQRRHVKHFLQGLHESGSQQLLCSHAFMSNDPKAGYEEVSKKLVKYCEGHPLALEVLGKSLYNRDLAYWEECLEGLKQGNDSPINNVLRKSFDTLPSQNDKDLFKHIACFFVGMDRDVGETILQACGIKTIFGIKNLTSRCLLSIGWNNELMMHQLVQEMGRIVVREESADKPWKRSRLWCPEDSFEVLKQEKGTTKIVGLSLDMNMLESEKSHKTFELKTDALRKMDKLMLLQLNHVHMSGSYENFPQELIWLCMHGFPLKSIPSDLPMENLVALDMSYSKIESFDICYSDPQQTQKRQKLTGSSSNDKRLLGSLKILNLSYCDKLDSLDGFDQVPALERLIVTNCSSLLEVSKSIVECGELLLIDLSYCSKLKTLPQTIGMLNKVKILVLDGFYLSESQVEVRDVDFPEMFKAKTIGTDTKLSSSGIPKGIPSDLQFFTISLPGSLLRLSLKTKILSNELFPLDFSCLSNLEELHLDGCNLSEFRIEISHMDVQETFVYFIFSRNIRPS